jgi:chemotaxis protein MotB
MSAPGNRRRRSDHQHEEHPDERWLLTYSDMITLLMALFIVMWSISSVNISKFDQLKASLHSAFSGKVLPQNTSVLTGESSPFDRQGAEITPIAPNQPAFKMQSIEKNLDQAASRADLESLKRIQSNIEAFAKRHGFSGQLRTSIDERGLVLQLLTDEVLFDSGQAVLKDKSLPLLTEIAHLLERGGLVNPVRVEGNTDNQPIHGAYFHSNWQLSAARADAVLEYLLAKGVSQSRLSLAGYGDQRPIATNATAAGRSLNRRVNLVVLRRSTGTTQGSTTP